ncbi:Phospholipid Phosphatase-Related Protein Type 2 [Manis pentadactyla]|nr:Phospholipid Phosphatase-Related Protein Type 2 [Manis pentadactyla]
MVDRRCVRLRLPPGAQAPAAPAIGPDFEPPPRPDLRSSSSAASSLAPSYLLRSVQSGPRFRGEGDSDGSAGRKMYLTLMFRVKGSCLVKPSVCLALLCPAFLVVVVRVAEYRNHLSDVLAGFLTGAAIATFLVSHLPIHPCMADPSSAP